MLTHFKDVDHNVMLHLNNKDIKKICMSSKYLYGLCENENFWKNKMVYDDLVPAIYNKPINRKIYDIMDFSKDLALSYAENSEYTDNFKYVMSAYYNFKYYLNLMIFLNIDTTDVYDDNGVKQNININIPMTLREIYYHERLGYYGISFITNTYNIYYFVNIDRNTIIKFIFNIIYNQNVLEIQNSEDINILSDIQSI